jgi:lipoic acid synthetase
VAKGAPAPPAADEPERVAAAASDLGLDYVVLTSVTRDDLPDGGASAFAATTRALRARRPGTLVEVLIPDFGGREAPLREVVAASPDILGHNLETVASIYPRIGRPRDHYARSLEVLRRAQALGAATKSGLMLGLGETESEIRAVLDDLRAAGCGLLTLGQYLQPTRAHAPVARYVAPAEFEAWRREALDRGFVEVESGPLVRSSFHARQLHDRFRAATGHPPCAT